MKAINLIFIVLFGPVVFTGCYYDVIPLEPVDSYIERAEFNADIIPILNESCNYTGCHSTGGYMPDLTASNAYEALLSGGYIASANPELSILYKRITGTTAGEIMPPGGKLSNRKIQTILKWISDGAMDN